MTPPITQTIAPRIYVACLAAYNNGQLHGAWIDAEQEPGDIHAEIAEMLAASPQPNAEEWAIHTTEGYCGWPFEAHTTLEDAAHLAALIVEHGPAFVAYAMSVGVIDEARDTFDDAYCGEHESERAYAEELADDLYGIGRVDPSADTEQAFLARYFDADAFARDLFVGDCFSVNVHDHNPDAYGVYVFRNV